MTTSRKPWKRHDGDHSEARKRITGDVREPATLLDALGTMSGLIHAFAAVATVNRREANCSRRVSRAYELHGLRLDTRAGAFAGQSDEPINSLETASVKFLNALTDRQSARAQSRLALAQAAER